MHSVVCSIFGVLFLLRPEEVGTPSPTLPALRTADLLSGAEAELSWERKLPDTRSQGQRRPALSWTLSRALPGQG